MTKLITSVIEFFHKPFRKIIPIHTFTYAAIGGTNTLFDLFLYFLTYNFIITKPVIDLGFIAISDYILAMFIVFPISFSSGFILHKYITFEKSGITDKIQLFKYALVVGGAFLLNYCCMHFFVGVIGFWPTISKALAAPIVIAFSYFSNTYFTFRK